MKTLANWNGQEMPLDEVMVPAMDRAFIFGDAVYEVMRIYDGRLWRMSDHLERLAGGLKELAIDFSIDELKERLQRTLKNSREREAIVYIQITRGTARRRFHHFPGDTAANCLIFIEHFDDAAAPHRQSGATAVTTRDVRWQRNDLKVTSLLANCMAAQVANSKGCIEAIMLRDGLVTEGSRTSVFGVKAGEVIVSPAGPHVLPGITKRQVIEICKSKSIPMTEGRITEEELFQLDEVFITGTTIQIVPIISVDEKPIGDGKPGSVVKRLQSAFAQAVSDWLAKATA
jgi:D-alanine transaminase